MVSLLSTIVSTVILGLGCPATKATHPESMPIEKVIEYGRQASDMCEKMGRSRLPPEMANFKFCAQAIEFFNYDKDKDAAQARFACVAIPPTPQGR